MKKRFVFMVFAFFAACAAAVAAPGGKGFSADMVSRAEGQEFNAKVYWAEDRMRMETPESIIITRLDKKMSWVIMTGQGMYMEQPIQPSQAAKMSKSMPGEMSRQLLGKETVNGRAAEKFKVTYDSGGRKETILQYVSDGWIPVRVQSEDGSWSVDYKNVAVGEQAADLFELPAGYLKFEAPSFGAVLGAGADQA